MEHPETLQARASDLSALVAEKFGPKGPDLRRQARKLGRRVPKAVRTDLTLVGDAATWAHHPKMSRRYQPQDVGAAERRATAYLAKIDPEDRRRGALLSWAGANAVNILVLFAAFVAVLRWRGFV